MKKIQKISDKSRKSIQQPNKIKLEAKREKTKKALKRVEKKLLAPSPNNRKQAKTQKIKTNKLTHNPLFIQFLNWQGDRFSIEKLLERIGDHFSKQEDKDLALSKKTNLTDEYLNNLTNFQKVFKKHMQDSIVTKTVSDNYLAWLSNSHKYLEINHESISNDEEIVLQIRDPKGLWFESLICHNFVMTFNYFGLDVIKNCPICTKFFSHKGPYAKYCSEGCKDSGGSVG